MRHRGRLIVLLTLIASLLASPAFPINGPQTDIYYYADCPGDEVGHKWKECGNSGWQMSGTTAPWMLVVTFDCETSEYVRKYYHNCLFAQCEVSEADWIAHWSACQ